MASPDRSFDVFLEGPYGRLSERLDRFDKVLIIVGGVGATFGMGVMSQLEGTKVERKLIWCTRSRGKCLRRFFIVDADPGVENISWFEDVSCRTDVDIYITQSQALASMTSSTSQTATTSRSNSMDQVNILAGPATEEVIAMSPLEDERAVKKLTDKGKIRKGRPDLQGSILSWVDSCERGAKVAVLSQSSPLALPSVDSLPLVCGPLEMGREVAKTVSDIEWDIARGRSGIAQLWMHKEVFGW